MSAIYPTRSRRINLPKPCRIRNNQAGSVAQRPRNRSFAGFAFVEMGTEAEEAAAIEALTVLEWMVAT